MKKKSAKGKSKGHPAGTDPFGRVIERLDVAAVKKLIADGIKPDEKDAERAAELSNEAYAICGQRELELSERKPTAKQIRKAEAESLAGYEMTKALLAAGAPAPNELCPAARAGNARLALLLIQHGADVNFDPPMGTPLENAVQSGNLQIIRALIKAGADVNHQDYLGSVLKRSIEAGRLPVTEELIRGGAEVSAKPRFGQTALMAAVESGREDFVRLLLKSRADVNLKNYATVGEFGEPEVKLEGGLRITRMENPESLHDATPLIVAARKGFAGIASQLIAAGADLEAVDANGLSAMAYAVRMKNPAMIKLLTDAGAKPLKFAEGSRDLAWIAAAKNGDCARLLQLLKDGVDVNLKHSSTTETEEGTALTHAAENGHLEAVKLLIASGANVEEHCGTRHDVSKRTALMHAARGGQAAIVTLLIASGATVPAKDSAARRPMHYAAGNGHAEVIRVLARRDAKVDMADRNGTTPLMEAAGNGHLEAVRALLDLKADPNAQTTDGTTALFNAADGGQKEVVQLLLDRGANVTVANARHSPLEFASMRGHKEIVNLLLEARRTQSRLSGKPAVKPDGQALISAVMSGNAETVRSLLDAGADANAVMDDTCFTALMTAVRVGNLEIVKMLLKAGAEVNAMNEDRQTALDLAHEGNRIAKDQLKFLGLLTDNERAEIKRLGQQLKAAGEGELPPVLRAAGGKRGKELKGVRAPKAKTKEPAAKRDYSDLPLPDFKARAKSPGFRAAIKELEGLCAAKAKAFSDEEDNSLAGCVRFQIKDELADKLLAEHHEAFLRRGFYLLKCSRGYASGKDELALLPTDRRAEVFAALQTNGANSDVYPADVVRWFDELEKSQPFLLTGASHDWCEGRFTKPIKDSKQLAKKMYEFCPDIVDQGVARLALELKKSQKFFFWWD